MKKRLRKKKRVSEFREFGFEVRGQLRPGLENEALNAFVDRLLAVVEARKLSFAGGAGGDHQFDGFVMRAARGSAIEEDRTALAAFFASDDIIEHHDIGALRDAWHGWD